MSPRKEQNFLESDFNPKWISARRRRLGLRRARGGRGAWRQPPRTRRRTQWVGGIRIGKAHTTLCETVNVWRFVEATTIASRILPSKVIHNNEDHIWLFSVNEKGQEHEPDISNPT
mgnify:CR=1 FL=1